EPAARGARARGPARERDRVGKHRHGRRRFGQAAAGGEDRGGQAVQPERVFSRRRGRRSFRRAGSPMIHKKMCMLSSSAVGKKSLVTRFVKSIFTEKYQTTVGVKVEKKEVSVNG